MMSSIIGSVLVVIVILVVVLHSSQSQSPSDYYTAAVYEHCRFGTSEDPPRLIVDTNLAYYKRAAEIAKSKGADIITFPEYGIFPPGTREELKDFLETCPDPKVIRSNPCEQGRAYSRKPILHTLSCIAKNNSMVVVANTGDIQRCNRGDPKCPSDGVFHFNTQVVFNRDGSLMARYHKEHLFYEFGMDLAREQQDTTFKTDFGTFGTYICFDIDFGRMSEVALSPSVDGIFFSTMWVDQPPQMTSVQVWQKWALAHNSSILASNIQIPGYYAMGSGIFHDRDGVLGYTFNPDGLSKVVVAKVAKRGAPPAPADSVTIAMNETNSWEWTEDGKNVPETCSTKLLNSSSNIYTDYRCVEENTTDYFWINLADVEGHSVQACRDDFCCSLEYGTLDGLKDRFYLGVFSGIYHHFDRYSWCEEDCILVRCDPLGDNPCGTYPMTSETKFYHARLKANFTSKMVYPTMTQSGMRLVPQYQWAHERNPSNEQEHGVHIHDLAGRKLIAVGLKGRCYDKDPPYHR